MKISIQGNHFCIGYDSDDIITTNALLSMMNAYITDMLTEVKTEVCYTSSSKDDCILQVTHTYSMPLDTLDYFNNLDAIFGSDFDLILDTILDVDSNRDFNYYMGCR